MAPPAPMVPSPRRQRRARPQNPEHRVITQESRPDTPVRPGRARSNPLNAPGLTSLNAPQHAAELSVTEREYRSMARVITELWLPAAANVTKLVPGGRSGPPAEQPQQANVIRGIGATIDSRA